MADNNRDIMATKLAVPYPTDVLSDAEGKFWVSRGFEPCGPGDKHTWYKGQGAVEDYYGDVERDYWARIF